ncbi:DUF3617 family protein [Roseateles asaccharophilus]|uniref:DUF3617 family protein n=1 Tax=Roseateles asaccharophilus TaxID=582607 RepID=A0ABU2ADV2_9BURK|nr:DUF3617 family protein [Roseateles asaccharophilus]MDR7335370.1 hypothetical protein [Roseateles asaccharophilus]
MHRFSSPIAVALLAALALPAAAAPVLELKPGLWAHESEAWINGQSVTAALKGARERIRAKLNDAQKREFDAEQGDNKRSCLAPQQARIDLSRYLESVLNNAGDHWRCEVKADQLDSSSSAGSYACRTDGGGRLKGRFTASYGPTQYKLELNGRGNAINGDTGEALGGDMDQRMLSTGRWLGGSC